MKQINKNISVIALVLFSFGCGVSEKEKIVNCDESVLKDSSMQEYMEKLNSIMENLDNVSNKIDSMKFDEEEGLLGFTEKVDSLKHSKDNLDSSVDTFTFSISPEAFDK